MFKRSAIFLLLLTASTLSLTAQQICFKCDIGQTSVGTWANCYPTYFGEPGRVVCVGNQTDCHDGTEGPCTTHCHVSVQTCTGNDYCETHNDPQRCYPDDAFNGTQCSQLPGGCDDRYSPLVVKTDSGPWKFTSHPVLFDIDGDGIKEWVSWPTGAGVAFIAVDRNGNGQIDGGQELFGDYGKAQARGDKSKWNGFEWLRMSDSNGNGMIDQYDAIWPNLLLWEDLNHNGISEPNELRHISQTDITALGLDYHVTQRRDPDANVWFKFEGKLWKGDVAEPYYDVFFKKEVQ